MRVNAITSPNGGQFTVQIGNVSQLLDTFAPPSPLSANSSSSSNATQNSCNNFVLNSDITSAQSDFIRTSFLIDVEKMLFGPPMDIESVHPKLQDVFAPTFQKMKELDAVRYVHLLLLARITNATEMNQ